MTCVSRAAVVMGLAPDKGSPSETDKTLCKSKQSYRMRCAVTICTAFSGVFYIVAGCKILMSPWRYHELSTLIQTSAGFAFVVAILNVIIIYSVLSKDDKFLKYSLCATIAVHMVSLPLVFCTFFGVMVKQQEKRDIGIASWEMNRFFVCVVHMVLLYLMLLQLRGETLDTSPPPPPEDEEGSLKKILVHTGPCPPTDDKLILKFRMK